MRYYYFGDLSSIIKDLLTMNMQQMWNEERTWKDMLANMEAYSKFNKYDNCNNVTMDVNIDNKTVSFRMTETDPFNKIKLHLDADCKNNLDFQVVYQPHDNVLQNKSGTIGLISLNELSKLNQIDLDLDNDYIYVTKSKPKTYHYLILSKKSEHQVMVRCST